MKVTSNEDVTSINYLVSFDFQVQFIAFKLLFVLTTIEERFMVVTDSLFVWKIHICSFLF